MRNRKYLNAYTFQNVTGSDGRLHTIAIYTGSTFYFRAKPEKLRRSKIACACAALVCCAAVLVPLIIITPVIRVWYVMLPLILALLPVLEISLCVGRALAAKKPVTREQKDRIDGRLAPWSIALLALSALSIIGQAVYYIRSGFLSGDLPVSVCTLVLAAAAAFLLAERGAFKMDGDAPD